MTAGLKARDVGRDGADMDEISAAVGASSTIFLDWSVLSGKAGEAKGGLSTPTLGVIINFWLVGGIDRSLWMRSVRSVMVESGGKSKV